MKRILEKSDCWAAGIDGCEGKISREHIFTESLFSTKELITVSGFSWCKGEEKQISIASLTSKILCKKHNSALSPLDGCAADAFKMFEKGTTLTNSRLRLSPPFKVYDFHVNGYLFERWLLKTFINICVTYQPDLFIGNGENPGVPTNELIEMCYGKIKFPGSSGMYLTSKVGMPMKIGPAVGFSPVIYDGTHVVGGFFSFRGFQLYLSLFNEKLNDFQWISGVDFTSEWQGTIPSWHFKKITIMVRNIPSFEFHFDW